MRNVSKIAAGWWDYTTLDEEILRDAANLTEKDVRKLARPGFSIKFYDTLEDFYLAEALEYIQCWKKATADKPAGICGPVGPTEQLPLVAKIVNDLDINIKNGHFWAMDEWYADGTEMPLSNRLSFARTDLELCFKRINKKLLMPKENIHFLRADNIAEYTKSYDEAKCLIMQGGQGETKHWAFNDPVKREGKFKDNPPSPGEYKKLKARVVDLHPLTIIQNARTSGEGIISDVPSKAITVGPFETWKSGKVSIWHAGTHDNSFGMKLTTLMISKNISDSSVPMSLLADHPDVQFNFYRGALSENTIQLHWEK